MPKISRVGTHTYRASPIARQGGKLNVRQKKQVKRLISNVQEKKFWPVFAGYATVNATGTLTNWSAITQGDTVSTRDGSEINFVHMELRYNIFPSAAAANIGNAFRIIVFQWKSDNSTAPPGVSDILDTSFTQPCFSPVRMQTHLQFRVMHDRLYRLYNAGPGAAGATVRIRRAAKKMRYNGASTGTNQIYCLVISDAAIQTPSWSYGGYLRFTDS